MIKKHFAILLSGAIAFSLITNSVAAFAEERTPTEIIEERSEFEKHFDNGDGTVTSYISSVPLHCYQDGTWLDIDNTLVPDENGNYVNQCNSMKVTISGNSETNPQQLVQISKDNAQISWGLLSADPESGDTPEIQAVPLTILQHDTIFTDSLHFQNEAIKDDIVKKAENRSAKAAFKNIYHDTDIELEVDPAKLKETIVLSSAAAVQESYSYTLDVQNLNVSQENNTIHFYDNISNNEIFVIPAPFMFDSSENPKNCTNIKTTLTSTENGYILTIAPDQEWLFSSDRVYPIYIDPTIDVITHGIIVRGMDREDPMATIVDDEIRIGNVPNVEREAFLYFQCPVMFFDRTAIINAQFHVGVNPHSGFSTTMFAYKSLHYPKWISGGGNHGNTVVVSSFYVSESNHIEYCDFDITPAVQGWMNYEKTFSSEDDIYAGIGQYGFRLRINDDFYVKCHSETGSLPPFVEITSSYSPKYRIEYYDYKFNDYGAVNPIENFKARMNCYAYALQMYYRGNTHLPYRLVPGEFGIQRHTPSQIYSNTYNVSQYQYSSLCTSNYGDLIGEYMMHQVDVSAFTEQEKAAIMSNYRRFIEEQMDRDAQQLNFTIENINLNSNTFYLPNNYNENNERIIGMIVYATGNTLDYHYYTRNGNGTCQNSNHPSTCSQWTHKPGSGDVSEECFGNHILCDQTIGEHAFHLLDGCDGGDEKIVYYRISQDAILYNSYFEYGHNSTCTGTPYT